MLSLRHTHGSASRSSYYPISTSAKFWLDENVRGWSRKTKSPLNPFRTAVSFWGQLGTNSMEFECLVPKTGRRQTCFHCLCCRAFWQYQLYFVGSATPGVKARSQAIQHLPERGCIPALEADSEYYTTLHLPQVGTGSMSNGLHRHPWIVVAYLAAGQQWSVCCGQNMMAEDPAYYITSSGQ